MLTPNAQPNLPPSNISFRVEEPSQQGPLVTHTYTRSETCIEIEPELLFTGFLICEPQNQRLFLLPSKMPLSQPFSILLSTDIAHLNVYLHRCTFAG